jgi:hypothetical protein
LVGNHHTTITTHGAQGQAISNDAQKNSQPELIAVKISIVSAHVWQSGGQAN